MRRFENAVQRDRQLDHAEIRTEMAAGLRQDFDQFVTHFLRELRKILFAQRLDVGRRTDAISRIALARLVASEESDFIIFTFRFFGRFGGRCDLWTDSVRILSPSVFRRCYER